MRALPQTSKKAGFSLIEVTIAIGIVSMAVLPLLGTMGVGLNTIHDARKDMTEAQIITQIASSALQTPFDKISASGTTNGPFYFDQFGRQLPTLGSTVLYSGSMNLNANATVFPGSLSGTSSVKQIQIIVSTIIPKSNPPKVITSTTTSLIIPKS